MDRKLSSPLLVTAAALAMAAPASAHSDSITKTEIRSDPPAITDRRLRDMIWDMFEREDLRRPEPPQTQLGRLWFRTRPIATSVPDLCRFDSAVIEFAPARHTGKRDADTPVHPVGITATSHFRFLAPPALEPDRDEAHATRPLPTDGSCASIDTKKTDFFDAATEWIARDGYRAFLKLQQALREKKTLPLDCDLYPGEESRGCAEIILAIAPPSISSVEECDSRPTENCVKVYADDREIRIFLNRASYPNEPQERPIRATLESLVTIADRIID